MESERDAGKGQDELRPEYDLKELLKEGVRGKYVERYRAGTNLVLLESGRQRTTRARRVP